MKKIMGSAVLCLAIADAGVAYSQSFVKGSNDPFTGTWTLDFSKSRYIDELKSRHSSPESKGPYGVKEEVVTLKVENNAEHCINDLTFEDGTRSQSEYTATYNDA